MIFRRLWKEVFKRSISCMNFSEEFRSIDQNSIMFIIEYYQVYQIELISRINYEIKPEINDERWAPIMPSRLGSGQPGKWFRQLKSKSNIHLIINIILTISFKNRWFHVSPEWVKSCECLICSPTANFSGTMATHNTTQPPEASYRWQYWLYSESSSRAWGWGRSKGTSFFQQPKQRAK